MGSTVSTPWEYANQLLEIAQEALDDTFGGPIPSDGEGRALVALGGTPIIDCCPWLSVHIAGQGVASTNPQGPLGSGHKKTTKFVPQVSFLVVVARCIPGLEKGKKLPSVAALENAARATSEDMWAITDAVRKEDIAGTLFAGACREVEHLGSTPIDPAGGCAGWLIRYRATIEGITSQSTT